ncbi:MAG TPA: glycosyltransferase, partial [Candidatus Acidoferrum sp.]|nr:glycosyltransferase [Candidatus Acidoferrum sp.]
VATDVLRHFVECLLPTTRVWVVRNAVNRVMVAMTRHASADRGKPSGLNEIVRIGYFSGTPTHAEDFEQCAEAVAQLLERFANLRLMLVGHIDVPSGLGGSLDKIEVLPSVPWRKLPSLLAKADINLAPLRLDAFTSCKCATKYLEAGLLGVPTAASPVGEFSSAIDSLENGVLCDGPHAWLESLSMLIQDFPLRYRLGRCAYERILAQDTTYTRISDVRAVIEAVTNKPWSNDPLTTNKRRRGSAIEGGGARPVS